MELLKIGVFVSMLSMTPMLEAQNISGLQKEQPLLLLEENLEQLSIGNEEEYGWEDELEELSRRLQEPVNLNAATKRQLEQFPFLTDIQYKYTFLNGPNNLLRI